MFKEEIPGGPEMGIYYIQRFFEIIARLFSLIFGGDSSAEDDSAAE